MDSLDERKIVASLFNIQKHLEHINWNLGKLVSIKIKDEKTFKKILDDEKKSGA